MMERIKYYITEVLAYEDMGDIAMDEDLLGNGIIDSTGMMRLISFIEVEADITVPNEDMTIDHFMTLQHIEDYIKKRGHIDSKET